MPSQLGNNYPNPLDNFRTYSYHFVMTASSTTEAFRKMIGDGNKAPLLSAIQGIGLGDEFKVENQTGYLVIDTRRFSQYSITDLEMEHVYGTGGVNNPSVPASTMKVKVMDTTGLSFFNFMMDLMRNKLQTTRGSAFFLLAILFVGHKDDGTTETISTCYIPLTLLLMSMEFQFSGSTYDIEFMELEGAPQANASMQHINYLATISNVNTVNRDKTIGGLLDSLESKLNRASLDHYVKYTNTALAQDSKSPPGKLVQYMITAPAEWRAFVPGSAKADKHEEKPAPRRGGGVKPSTASVGNAEVSFSPNATITDAIKSILESSKQFTDLASADNRKAGTGFTFKTVTAITCDDATYVVHFDIYPFRLPKIDGNNNKVSVGNKTVVGDASIVKNLITYDYIFTGRNSHIKNLKVEYGPEASVALDVNLQLGSARMTDNARNGQTQKGVQDSSTGAKKTTEFSTNMRPGDPLFLPVVSKEQKNNNSSQHTEHQGKEVAAEAFKSKQEYNQTFAFLHFLSSINLDVTVRGNPNIIRKFADRNERGGLPPHGSIISGPDLKQMTTSSTNGTSSSLIQTVNNGITSSKQQYISAYITPRINAWNKTGSRDALLNGVDVTTLPVFVKINIRAPNVDSTGTFKPGEEMFTDKFFYDGVYQMLFVKTTFAGGDFEHNISLIPYDIDGKATAAEDTTNARKAN